MSARAVMSSLGILLISGTHERAHYALMLATGGSALGRDVTLFATNAGCRALLAAPDLPDPEGHAARLAGTGVADLATLWEAAGELPIRLIACESGLLSAGIDPSALRGGVEVAGIATFLEATGGGQIITL